MLTKIKLQRFIIMIYSLLPRAAFQCRGEQTKGTCLRDCKLEMKCTYPIELNSCPVNFTIVVNLTTDVFIYQRNTSDGLVNECSSSGSDCLYDDTETLNYTVTDVKPKAAVPEHKTCRGSNSCEVKFSFKSPFKTTRCTGRYTVFVNYICVQETGESTDESFNQ